MNVQAIGSLKSHYMIVVFQCYDTGFNEWWSCYEFSIITRIIISDNMDIISQWVIKEMKDDDGMMYCDKNGIICHKYIINKNIIRCRKFNQKTNGILTDTIIKEDQSQYGMLQYYYKIT